MTTRATSASIGKTMSTESRTNRGRGFPASVAAALGIALFVTLATQSAAAEDTSIRPFRAHVPDAALADLRRRIAMTSWPDNETVSDQSQGIPLAKLKPLVEYWGTRYSWRKAEATLNALPQFVTNIDGVDIHFIHVRSKHPGAVPLIITHGWPGSVFENIKVVGPLTDPTAYGGTSEDAFDVVIPSMPGYGFSSKPKTAGWGVDRIAQTWAKLMTRLGYNRYVAQGGDWGSPVSSAMARQNAPGLIGIHINLAAVVPPEVAPALATNGPAPAGLTPKERATFDELVESGKKGNRSYAVMMGTRPQTLGYAISDSPAGLAAWMLGHPGFLRWTYDDSDPEKSPEEVLNDVTLYWLTKTATSASRLYWEAGGRSPAISGPDNLAITLPVAITVFPGELYHAPETWARRAYRNLTYFHEVDKGGHFAAWEEPQLFTSELRAAFKPFRNDATHVPERSR
jgi:pimeloyl-ACP methyl ester carboxylesterase